MELHLNYRAVASDPQSNFIELQLIDAGEVAQRVVDVYVLRAGARTVDPIGARRGEPLVDCDVELQTRVRVQALQRLVVLKSLRTNRFL
jgi:hypothetical protein